jgi:hypothetical protein
VCKQCGGPSPVGIGYVSTEEGAAERSATVTACACGYSVKSLPSPVPVHRRKTRVTLSTGDPGKWQAQYYDASMESWFDIGDAQTIKTDAEARERDYSATRYLLSLSEFRVGMPVLEWDGEAHNRPGIVTEITDTSATVEWPEERTPGCPGSKGTRFLVTILPSGVLIAAQ